MSPPGQSYWGEVRDMGDLYMAAAFAASDWLKIADLVAAGLDAAERVRLDNHETVAFRQELRLRFNAPTRVACWTLRVSVSAPGLGKFSGEIELFQWPGEESTEPGWELVDMQLRPER